jgi:hypothetical protein
MKQGKNNEDKKRNTIKQTNKKRNKEGSSDWRILGKEYNK